MSNVEQLHAQMMNLPMRDLLLLASQAFDMRLEEKRTDLILKIVEIRIKQRMLARSLEAKP